MLRRYLMRMLCALLCLWTPLTVHGADKKWTAAVSGDFADPARWTGGVPAAGDTASFNEPGVYTVTFDNAPNPLANPVLNQDLFFDAGTATFTSGSGGPYTYRLTGAGGDDAAITSGALTLGTSGNPLHLTVDDDLVVRGGSMLNVNFGSQVNTLDLILAQSGGNGTVVVDGAGSQLNVTNANTIGQNGNIATLTYRNSASGSLGGLTLAFSGIAASAATLNVESGAMVTSGSLSVGTSTTAAATGTVNIDGSGSTLTLNPASTLTVGGTVGVGEVNIGSNVSGGTLTTGTGTATINAGGRVTIGAVSSSSGTFNVNGDLNINGGTLSRLEGEMNLASGTTMTVQNGGLAFFSSAIGYTTPANVTYNISSGGSISAPSGLKIGTLGTNTFTVDGAGSSATGVTPPALTAWGDDGGVANVTFSNGATGTFGGIEMANSATAGTTANVDILSGADLTLNNSLSLAASGGATTSATLDIQGSGSTLIQTGAVGVTVGHASEGTATINIGTTASGAELETGAGTLTINATGTVNVGSGANTGTLDANGNITVAGGELNVAQGSSFQWGSSTMDIQNGGRVSISGGFSGAGATINIEGADSTLETLVGFTIFNGGQVNVLSGGHFSTAGFVSIATAFSNGTLTVDGVGSTVTATSSSPNPWGSVTGTATVVFRNQATGNFTGEIRLVADASATANVTIESGADLTAGGLLLATLGGVAAANLTIDGAGSTVNLNPGTDLTIGHASSGTADINVENGGALTVGTGGETILNATGTINIDGGFVDLKTLTDNGGTINFTAGSLSYLGNLTVGTGGLLGTDLTLTATRQLTLDGTTSVDAFHTLTLDGGSISTGSLVVDGTFAFNSGTLSITGVGGLTVGSGGPFGSAFTLGAGRTLNVTNTTTISSGALFVLDSGATFTSGTLANNGEFALNGLAATANATTVNNAGLIRGEGRIIAAVNNNASGEIRAEFGKRIKIDGANGANAGLINLQGGTAEFTQALTNGSSGQILGRGTLSVGGSGLANQGHVALSSGITDVFGDVTNDTADVARGISVSGNADVTFWDDVTNVAGSLFRVSAGSSATFFGTFAGVGISGPGDVYLEADVTPGASPAAIEFGGNLFLGANASLVIELGGATLGSEFDHIAVAGVANLDGDLDVQLINGFNAALDDMFEIIMASGGVSGMFDTLPEELPTLASGLEWAINYGANNVVLQVVEAGLPGDFNNDGVVDTADYVVWSKGGLGVATTPENYNIWRTNFGATSAGSGAAESGQLGVPEPNSLLLGAVGVLFAVFARRGARRFAAIRA